MSTLSRVMQKSLKSAPRDLSIAEAAQKMRRDRIGSLLIERNGELVGIVTETDIVREAVADRKDLETTTVESIMTTPLNTIQITRNIHDTFDMMGDLGIRHLVVCEGNRIVGMVSARDLLLYFRSTSEPKIGVD